MPENPVHLWLGLALSIFGIVYGLRRTPYVRKVWEAIPTELKPFAPIALGVTLSGVEAVASGRSVRQALAIAASAALTAMLGHHALKFAPGPYGTEPAPRYVMPPAPTDDDSTPPPTGGPPQAAE